MYFGLRNGLTNEYDHSVKNRKQIFCQSIKMMKIFFDFPRKKFMVADDENTISKTIQLEKTISNESYKM